MNLELVLGILIKNTATIGVFFLIGALIKIYTYYKLFGIYIYEFITLNEILILFVNNLISYFVLLGLVVICISLSAIWHTYLVLFLASVGLIGFGLLRRNILLFETFLQIVMIWSLFFSITNLLAKLKIVSNADKQSYHILAFLLVTIVIYSVVNGLTEYFKVRYKHYYSRSEISLDHIEFKSNLEKYYIGKTDKFVFIYDSLSKSTEVIPASSIKKMTFKKHQTSDSPPQQRVKSLFARSREKES